MSIEDIKAEKEQFDLALANMITFFEANTKCSIDRIEIQRREAFCMADTIIINSTVKF